MSEPYYLAQITDCHLQNDPAQRYRERDVEASFDAVVADLQHNYPAIDRLLLTGDLVHHGGPAGYQRLLQKIRALELHSHWIPGNHDDATLMQQLGGDLNRRSFRVPGWGMILLDSTALPDGRGSGSLADSELEFLLQQLEAFHDSHCLVVLHHNPIPVQSVWQDEIRLGNSQSFWDIAERHPQLKGVIFGHVHQEWDIERNGVRVLSCPASSVQFKKHCDAMTLEGDPVLQLPAYRTLALYTDGRIETSVKRVAVGGCAD
ncbi:MAG: metallophosphoesterase [Amphritea sp.]